MLIGEMRDLETVRAALTVAETGHLVLSTLHTNSAVQTINRIIDIFPESQQPQVRAQLSLILAGRRLAATHPHAPTGAGRVLAVEVMIPNPAIRNLIREAKIHQIYSQLQVGQAQFGMQTMTQSLLDLYTRRLISYEEAHRPRDRARRAASDAGRGAAPARLSAAAPRWFPPHLPPLRVSGLIDFVINSITVKPGSGHPGDAAALLARPRTERHHCKALPPTSQSVFPAIGA